MIFQIIILWDILHIMCNFVNQFVSHALWVLWENYDSDGFSSFLSALNKDYPKIPIDNGHIRIIARAIEYVPKKTNSNQTIKPPSPPCFTDQITVK